MDNRRSGLLLHFVLVLMLLEVQWRPVLPAPTPINLTKQLIHEAEQLLSAYLTHHGEGVNDTKEGVPSAKISGDNKCQKLQDVYIKNVLFYLHIVKVQEYNNSTFGSPSIARLLSQMKGSLRNHSARIKALLNDSVPPTAEPPQPAHNDDFAKREYGWAVIDTLKEWLEGVEPVLQEVEEDATPSCEV